jgi:hypothetical protein
MAMERHEVHGVKVYQLDICDAIGDHHLCPGITTLKAADFDLARSPVTVPVTRSLKMSAQTNQGNKNDLLLRGTVARPKAL